MVDPRDPIEYLTEKGENNEDVLDRQKYITKVETNSSGKNLGETILDVLVDVGIAKHYEEEEARDKEFRERYKEYFGSGVPSQEDLDSLVDFVYGRYE